MFTVLLYALLLWFLYNLVFRFIIPIYRTTRRVKRQFAEMQTKMHENMSGAAAADPAANAQAARPGASGASRQYGRAAKDDYLDFEEVK